MKILSLHLGHNATAAIAVDGKIVGVFSQEKTDNIKNSAAFPKDAIITSASLAQAVVDDTDSSRVWFHQNDSTGFKPFIEGETVTGGGGSGTLVTAGVDADTDAWEHGDVEKMSGQILYIENRAPVIRSANQTEDIKVVLTL